MPNPILEYSTYKASTVVGEVAVEGFEYPNGKKVPKEGAPLQELMARLGYTGKRDVYDENDQVTGTEDLETTGAQRLYTLGEDGQLKPYAFENWAEAVRFIDAGNVIMAPEESTGKMFCMSAQANEDGGFDYFAMNEENLRAARAAQEKLPPRPTRLQRVGDFFMKLFGSRNQACKAYDDAQPARDAFSPVDKVGAAMAAKERTEAQYVDAVRVAKEQEAARQQRKREAEREAERKAAQKREAEREAEVKAAREEDQAAAEKNLKELPHICDYSGVLEYEEKCLRPLCPDKIRDWQFKLYGRVVAAAYLMAEKKDLTMEQLLDVAAGKPAGMSEAESKRVQDEINTHMEEMKQRFPDECYDIASQRMSELFLQCGDYNTPTAMIMAAAISNGLLYASNSRSADPPLVKNAKAIAKIVEYAEAGQQCVEVLAHPASYVPKNEITPPLPVLFGGTGYRTDSRIYTPFDFYNPQYVCRGLLAKEALREFAEKPAEERLKESIGPKDSPAYVNYQIRITSPLHRYAYEYGRGTPEYQECCDYKDPKKSVENTLKNLKGGIKSPMMQGLVNTAKKSWSKEDKVMATAISARLNRSQPIREQPQKKASNAIVK